MARQPLMYQTILHGAGPVLLTFLLNSLWQITLAARADLGLAYFHMDRFPDAVKELSKALDSDEKGDIHYQLSITLRKLGRTGEADAALQQSVAIRRAALKREQRLLTDR